MPSEEPRKCPVSDESNKKVVVELKWLESEGNASRNAPWSRRRVPSRPLSLSPRLIRTDRKIKTGSTRSVTPMKDNDLSSSADLLGGKTLGTHSAQRSTRENGYAFEDTKPLSRTLTRSATPFDTTSRSFMPVNIPQGALPLSRNLDLPEITEEQDKVPSIVEEMDLLTTYHGAASSARCSLTTSQKLQSKEKIGEEVIAMHCELRTDSEYYRKKMRAAGLHEAVLLGDLKTMESILEETDTDVNVTDGMDRTALHLAADRGHKDIVVMLIAKGCQVNSPDVEGRTPLHFAVESGDLDVVLALMTAGAEVDVVEKRRGRTPIHLAIVGNNLDILKVLLQPLVDDPQLGDRLLKLTEKDGRTLLHMAAHHGILEATYMLISAGAEVNTKDASGNTPMHAVILTRLRRKDRICSKVLEVLLESGGDVEGGSEGENTGEAGTLLHAAAFAGCLDCVRVLLKRSAKLETKNFYGKTPLQIAIEENHVDIVSFLVDNNACMETTDSRGQRPLHYAIMSDSPVLVEEILRSGADRNARDKDGNTYFQFAVIKRRYQALDALVKEKVVDVGEEQQAIHYCASVGDQAAIDVLLDNAFNINATDAKGRTALHLAISSGHESLVLHLLANGGSARRADDNGATPLHYAVRWGGSDALLRRLLKQKGNVNEVDRLGRTPLHYAASKSSIMSDMYILINNGAQINVRDDRGLTPLHLAARLGNESLVRILLDNDARHDLPDCDQFLPVDHARENGHKCIIKRLEAYHIKKERDKEARLKFYVPKKEEEEEEVPDVMDLQNTKQVMGLKDEEQVVVFGGGGEEET
ncbi:ankyrin-3-like [Macrobrachium nipponense]|uniref:ankyrin-3-like n=1 Tax=Macrobrachium nipponense TaxID=159736 RepID=UPI0030C86E51